MFKRVRYTYRGERWHMLVVHAVTLVDCFVGLATLGSLQPSCVLRPCSSGSRGG